MYDNSVQYPIQEVTEPQEKIPLNKDYDLNLDTDYSKLINQSKFNYIVKLLNLTQ